MKVQIFISWNNKAEALRILGFTCPLDSYHLELRHLCVVWKELLGLQCLLLPLDLVMLNCLPYSHFVIYLMHRLFALLRGRHLSLCPWI